jgi:hypothetical protein
MSTSPQGGRAKAGSGRERRPAFSRFAGKAPGAAQPHAWAWHSRGRLAGILRHLARQGRPEREQGRHLRRAFPRPSGLRIKCQQERSQGLNRYIARKLLADKIEEAKLGAESKRVQERERIRRQKRRRSRRAKNRMLDDKHARSATKNLRGKVGRDGGD